MKRLFTLPFAAGFAVCAHALSWVAVNTATQRNNLLTYASGLVDTLPAPYADKVAAFVSEVQADGTTTNWMEMTIQFAYDELLAPTMGTDRFHAVREAGLRLLDYPVTVDYNSTSNCSNDEFLSFIRAVCGHGVRTADRVMTEIETTTVPQGQMRIWHLYNMCFIFKTHAHTVMFDFTERPSSANLLSAIRPSLFSSMPNWSSYNTWSYTNLQRLGSLIDVAFTTHLHSDHLGGIEDFYDGGAAIVLPGEFSSYSFSMYDSAGNLKPDIYLLNETHTEPIDVDGIKVRNLVGYQDTEDCNVYHVQIDGFTIVHQGDNRESVIEANLRSFPPADVAVIGSWNRLTTTLSHVMNAPGYDPKRCIFLPSHEHEIHHLSPKSRETYMELYTGTDRLKANFDFPLTIPLHWGESYTIHKTPTVITIY